MPKIYPVIMSGGAGTRLWPLSRKKTPKQYHALITEQTMFAETLVRMQESQGNDVADAIIVCAAGHETLIKAQADSLGMNIKAILLEPVARNTAAAAAVAARYIHRIDPQGLMLLLSADHHIENVKGFWGAISKAADVAKQGYLMTLGIEPSRPETGFGYIRRGSELANGVFKIDEFKEKPDLATATSYLKSGEYSWNAGIFLFDIERLMGDFESYASEILDRSTAALDNAATQDNVVTLSEADFSQAPSEPIDIAIMEKTAFAGVVAPVRAGWNDIGSWRAIADLIALDSSQDTNVTGDAKAFDCENSYIRSDGPFVATVGVKNLIVIATDDNVLVIDKDKTQDVKRIVTFLKDNNRSDLL